MINLMLNTNRRTEFTKSILQKIRLRYLSTKDIRRFSKNAAFSVFDNSFDQLSARIMYNVHAIEKGLARSQNFRPGFGKKALSQLNDTLVVYERSGFDTHLYPYIQGRSIISKYASYHESLGEDVKFLEDIISPEYLKTEEYNSLAGVKTIFKKDKIENRNKNFLELSSGRSSIREFSGKPIDEKKIIEALSIAEKTPSVCNRQGWKVYYVKEKNKISKLLEFQKGFKGYSNLPEAVLVIGVTNNSFLSPVERNEAFVDGGLFAMSVLYGLEYEGLAAVALNAMMNSKDEDAIRLLLGIPSSVQLTLFIAVGDMSEEVKVPASDRRCVEEFMTII